MQNKHGILINDTSGEHHIGCDAVIHNIKSLCKERDIEITQTFTRQDVKINSPRLKEAITTCDIIIINGEGTLHDQYGRNFLRPLLQILPNKPIVLINSVWYNMGYVPEMSKCVIISFRETSSKQAFDKDHPLLAKISEVCPDVIFDSQYNLITMPYLGAIGYGDSVYGQLATKLSQYDNYFPLDYHRKAKTIIPIKGDVNYYISWLKGLQLYITGRFHGVCLSILAETPFLAFPSNAGKIEALIYDLIKGKELIINSLEEIEDKKKFAYQAQKHMAEYTGKARLMIRDLFDRIARL